MKDVVAGPAVVFLLILLVSSAGCTGGEWDFFRDLFGGPENTSAASGAPPTTTATEGQVVTPRTESRDGQNKTGPAFSVTGEGTPPVPSSAPGLIMVSTPTEGGTMDDAGEGTFSLQYTPPDGYTAEEGEALGMVFTIVPEGGFDDEVAVTLDLSVPDPVFGVFPLWSETYDMGTHTPPYQPITQTLVLDPENPPEEYAWVTDVYDTARSAGITEIDVNVHVSATGGGLTVEERLVYHVRLA